jgi:hypothetical protein
VLVIVVLQGLRWFEDRLGGTAARSRLVIHATPDPAAFAELEALVRRSGLDIERSASRREPVDLVIEFELRGPKRLHEQVLASVLHHPSVRTVSTGE